MSTDAPERPYVPFSSRYGLVKGIQAWGRMHWTARHADHGDVRFGCCPPDPRKACGCPGSRDGRQCCELATGEDLLCDACREHCWAVDDARNYHRIIDLYGVRSGAASQDPPPVDGDDTRRASVPNEHSWEA